jgi:hypothetical protein
VDVDVVEMRLDRVDFVDLMDLKDLIDLVDLFRDGLGRSA